MQASSQKSIRVLTIDGGEATGTSTAAKAVARELGMDFLDSGALYRTFAYRIQGYKLEKAPPGVLEDLAEAIIPRIAIIGGKACLDGKPMGEEIRTPEIGRLVKKFSKNHTVRRLFIPAQRSAVGSRGLVAEGRDMGTVIFPDALVKVFLTASIEERTRRRFADFQAKNIDITAEQVKIDILERDREDTERDIAPMVPAKDAVIIPTDGIPPEGVAGMIVGLWSKAAGVLQK